MLKLFAFATHGFERDVHADNLAQSAADGLRTPGTKTGVRFVVIADSTLLPPRLSASVSAPVFVSTAQ